MPGDRLLLALGVLALAGAPAAAEPTRIVVDQHLTPDGELAGAVLVEIERGKIVSIEEAPETPPEGAIAFEGVLAPGVVDVFSGVGVTGSTVDNTTSVAADLTALDAIDPLHPTFAEAARAGVTSALIGPAPTNPVSGVSVVVSTRHNSAGRLDVLNADGPVVFSLGPAAVDTAFGPTSRAGVLYTIRSAIDSGQGVLADVASGERMCVAFCPDGDDAASAVLAMGEFDIAPAIVHASDGIDLSEDFGDYASPFIVGPYTLDTPPAALAGPGFLARAGVPIVVHGDTGRRGFDHIRTTAALAVKYGLDPASARRAFTSEAARLAGIDGSTGSLTEGLRADLVVWSHDPLRADARPLAVWIAGEQVAGNSSGRTP
ncbi:MAG: amidohydrolase family protein [Planctomycetota bacterium]